MISNRRTKRQTRCKAGAQSQGPVKGRGSPATETERRALYAAHIRREAGHKESFGGGGDLPGLHLRSDRDGLNNGQEIKIITKTDPYDADTDDDKIEDGDEDKDSDGTDNTNELALGTKMNDDDFDDDGIEDGDENKDSDGTDNEDEDDLDSDGEFDEENEDD